eukprot:3380131-Pleurochrysis_carterae.AAC.6
MGTVTKVATVAPLVATVAGEVCSHCSPYRKGNRCNRTWALPRRTMYHEQGHVLKQIPGVDGGVPGEAGSDGGNGGSGGDRGGAGGGRHGILAASVAYDPDGLLPSYKGSEQPR